jgi:hypothetical protein
VLLTHLKDRVESASPDPGNGVFAAAEAELQMLGELEQETETCRFPDASYPAKLLVNAERIRCFREDATRVLSSLRS